MAGKSGRPENREAGVRNALANTKLLTSPRPSLPHLCDSFSTGCAPRDPSTETRAPGSILL